VAAESVTESATISVQTLLVIANSGLTLIAGHFIRTFVADVRGLTTEVAKLKTQVAVLTAVVNGEVKQFSQE
jgi:hypothetical protein